MKNTRPILSVFFHNYYGDDEAIIASLINEIDIPFTLFYNTVINSYSRLKQISPNIISGKPVRLIIRSSPNKGKDIGGKMVLMDTHIRLGIQSDFILLLHDKRSPYHSNSIQWKQDLFRVAKRENLSEIFSIFEKNKDVGIVASVNAIRNEMDNEHASEAYTGSELIQKLKKKYNIYPTDMQYVAGTMFCVRTFLFEEFFKLHWPLEIRSTLEEGNITDYAGPTITHSWERLLCWLITSKGYKIKGI